MQTYGLYSLAGFNAFKQELHQLDQHLSVDARWNVHMYVPRRMAAPDSNYQAPRGERKNSKKPKWMESSSCCYYSLLYPSILSFIRL